jgi:hypothetical protein
MKLLAQWLSGAVVVAIMFISAPRPAFADTYTIYDLGDANARGIFGMDTTGDVVIFQESCGAFGPSCSSTTMERRAPRLLSASMHRRRPAITD